MPRPADKTLEKRILEAAHRLWRRHGDNELTLRAVAREASTTTTTVYKHFSSKAAIRLALARRVHAQITMEVTGAATLEESYRRYLRYAENHPYEYKLLFGPLLRQAGRPGRPRPIKLWLLDRLADRFGGKPQDYENVYYGLFFMCHGAASLLTAARKDRANAELRKNCLALCDLLIEHVQTFRAGRAGRNGSRAPRKIA